MHIPELPQHFALLQGVQIHNHALAPILQYNHLPVFSYM
ncbi:hypothetical protein B4146_1634 [Bacillus subtilis]|uniref:Uncharacterized protein n=1 Tax=Bacillus subtilis TaxID=1423 RepID=A0AAP1E7H6_BACIU|nr:hypothetical protein B4146_1634 [Bacillus subtilis]KZD90087.1 hypothetical protein B4122_3455 [Bacillus subtilis]